jgi:hypothetical protein
MKPIIYHCPYCQNPINGNNKSILLCCSECFFHIDIINQIHYFNYILENKSYSVYFYINNPKTEILIWHPQTSGILGCRIFHCNYLLDITPINFKQKIQTILTFQ